MITIFSVFPADQRGRAMGIYGLGVVLAPALGPAVGGALVEHFGWPAVFFLAVPFCALGLTLAPLFIVGRTESGEPPPRFDWGGLVFITLFIACLLFALNASHRAGWFSVSTLGMLAVALAACGGFVWWEHGRKHAMLDLGVFASPQFAAASVVALAYGLGLYGTTYLLPLLVQTVAQYSPAKAGALLSPAGIALAVVLPLAGLLTDRFPARYLVTLGLVLFALSSLRCSYWRARDRLLDSGLVAGGGRIGLGLIIPALNAGAMHGLSAEHIGHGSSAINFIRQLGGAFGVNILSTFLEWRTLVHERAAGLPEAGALASTERIAAFHESFVLVALVFVLAVIPAWLMRRDRS
jgi:EmrB/QacA subfamily drug resistance transporter